MNGFTVFDYINRCWNEQPDKLKTNPAHLFAEPNTKQSFESCRRDYLTGRTFVKRHCFSAKPSIQSKNGFFFSVAIESAKSVFEQQTGLPLKFDPMYKDYYCEIAPENLGFFRQWEHQQGSIVFLQDCLSLSIALGMYKNPDAGSYTPIGQLVTSAKYYRKADAISSLIEQVKTVINLIPSYKGANVICSVPKNPNKVFDLPEKVTSAVCSSLNKTNVTQGFKFENKKLPIKEVEYAKKWAMWEETGLNFQKTSSADVTHKSVLLIDDVYQSGKTMQFVAMKLQEAGAGEVYGLCLTKTLGDYDNTTGEH